MKTFFEKLILHIDSLTHPSGGWLPQKAEAQRKRKAAVQPISIKNAVSPDCVAMRSPSKKQQQLRRTPAP
jgi:hypothetical protein